MKCNLHPKYLVRRAPRVDRETPGCGCWELWRLAQAVKLREAAYAFVHCGPVKDMRDTTGIKANAALLKAAVNYARAAGE